MYGAIFACLLHVLYTLNLQEIFQLTVSFWYFVDLYSEESSPNLSWVNGINFVVAQPELSEALRKLDNWSIERWLKSMIFHLKV